MKRILYVGWLRLTWTAGNGHAQNLVELLEQNCGPQAQALQEQMIFQVAETQPRFPGGMEAINQFIVSHVQTPSAEIQSHRPVVVEFVIDTTGQVQNVCIQKRKLDPPTPLELEILRVVQLLPKWIPGRQRRHKVPVSYVHRVRF